MNNENTEARICKVVDKTLCTRKLFVALCLGQTLSLLICGTAITSGLLGREKVNIPTAQSFLNYVALCLVYTTILACSPGEKNVKVVLRERGLKYFVLAFIDVEANYLIVKAYQYTTVTSVQLLDCFTIPTVLFCSWCCLRVRYRWPHFFGVAVCLLGMGGLILADVLVDKYSNSAQNKILGDFLCVIGATLYGLSNVGQEYVVRSFNRYEFLGMIGLFGSFINGVQFLILEREEIANIDFTNYTVVISIIVFALCLFALYSLMPIVIGKTSATAVNLNLLSADFYALLVGLFIFHYQFHILYIISFVVIVLGLFIYSARAPPMHLPQGADYTEVQIIGSSADDLETASPDAEIVDESGNKIRNENESMGERTSLKTTANETNYVEVRDGWTRKENIQGNNVETLC